LKKKKSRMSKKKKEGQQNGRSSIVKRRSPSMQQNTFQVSNFRARETGCLTSRGKKLGKRIGPRKKKKRMEKNTRDRGKNLKGEKQQGVSGSRGEQKALKLKSCETMKKLGGGGKGIKGAVREPARVAQLKDAQELARECRPRGSKKKRNSWGKKKRRKAIQTRQRGKRVWEKKKKKNFRGQNRSPKKTPSEIEWGMGGVRANAVKRRSGEKVPGKKPTKNQGCQLKKRCTPLPRWGFRGAFAAQFAENSKYQNFWETVRKKAKEPSHLLGCPER